MDFNKIITRVKGMLVPPKKKGSVIGKAGLYASSALILAFVVLGMGTFIMSRVTISGSILSTAEATNAKDVAKAISLNDLDDVPLVSQERLEKFLPQSLLHNKRIRVVRDIEETSRGNSTRIDAKYENESSAYIVDYGNVDSTRFYVRWFNVEKYNKENSKESGKTYRVKGRPYHEVGRSIAVIVADRFKVTISAGVSSRLSDDDLRYLIEEEIDLDKLAALK